MTDQRISELEHDTGQVLPCSWDECPECMSIKITRITINDKWREAMRAYPMDGSLLDLSSMDYYNVERKEWWR